MKLRVKDRVRLEKVLTDLEKGINFILLNRIKVMSQTTSESENTFVSTNPNIYGDKKYSSICKDRGSDIVCIFYARHELHRLLLETEKIVPV